MGVGNGINKSRREGDPKKSAWFPILGIVRKWGEDADEKKSARDGESTVASRLPVILIANRDTISQYLASSILN